MKKKDSHQCAQRLLCAREGRGKAAARCQVVPLAELRSRPVPLDWLLGTFSWAVKASQLQGSLPAPPPPKALWGSAEPRQGHWRSQASERGHLDWQPRECWAAAVKGIPLVAIKICSSSLAREALCSKPHTPYFVVCKGACWASCFHCSVLRKHVPSVFDPKSWIAKTDGHN